ncbi:MAG: GDSL-type esterase/lipase family protein [Bacteroidales bacterium]|jgi:lysophospholipase L1-like esterase|nr:GDSL-type esterase/lipase family protein [Bacteroidales bacterium]
MKRSEVVKYFLIIFINIFFIFNLRSQDSNVSLSEKIYPYIRYDSSQLENFGENKNLIVFFNKLDSLCVSRNSGLSVLHIGASHVQAGVWTLELRKLFETACPDIKSSIGFVFPFSVANTNHPYYYSSSTKGMWKTDKITDRNIRQEIGLSGITTCTTDDYAEIEIRFNERAEIEKHKFNKITIFHNVEDMCYNIKVGHSEFLDTVLLNYEAGATEFYFSTQIDSLKLIIEKIDSCNGEFCFYGAYLENTFPGITLSGIGINGASTKSYLKAKLFSKHLSIIKPDLVFLSIGVNDAADKDYSKEIYEANYDTIINQILNVNPDCAIIFTTNNDFYSYGGKQNKNQESIYEAMSGLSGRYGASIWNLFDVMGGYGSVDMWRKDNLAKSDRIHFTNDGYILVARLLFEAVMKDYENYLKNL